MLQRKAAIWVHNYSPSGAQQLETYFFFENLLPVLLLGCTNMFIPSHFWTTYTKFDNCCQRYISTCRKILYRCTYTFLALNYCGGIFFGSLGHLYEVGHTNFFADFWTFRNFWPQFCKNCGVLEQREAKWELSSASERAVRSKKNSESSIKIDP